MKKTYFSNLKVTFCKQNFKFSVKTRKAVDLAVVGHDVITVIVSYYKDSYNMAHIEYTF